MRSVLLTISATLLFASLAPLSSGQHGASQSAASGAPNRDWPVYGGDFANTHYSPLAQINRSNVSRLTVAWSFDTGESGGLQTSPLIVGGVLYGITPTQKIFALDAASGRLLWKFDSGIIGTQPDRGLAYWPPPAGVTASSENANAPARVDASAPTSRPKPGEARILVAVENFLYALDAATGAPITGFSENGRIDLRKNLGRDFSKLWVPLTSPGIIYKDLIIVGGRDPETLPAPPGDIRAYDVRSGELRWSFHTIPHPGEFGYDTWPPDAWRQSGAANNWAGMSLDLARGILYVPTGSAAFDFYGGDRIGDDLFANTLIALDAATGKRLWHFQGVHHDLWDRDFPAPPALLTVTRDGKRIDAVAQTTKQGFVYLFDRVTGASLFPIEYRNYPASAIPGEVAAAQQPLPTKPGPYARQFLTEDMLTTRTPEAHAFALEQFRKSRSEGQFVPLSLGRDTVIFPGFDGGAEWGGPAVDPETGILYVNSNEMAWVAALGANSAEDSPEAVYQSQCAVCHGDKRSGSPPAIPSLIGVASRLSAAQIASIIKTGRGRMNGFPNLSDAQIAALIDFLSGNKGKELVSAEPQPPGMKYRFSGYRKFLDADGYPAVAPPWGTLSAINLNTGEYVWKINLGEYPELAARGLKNTGSENYGGPVVTAGGLLFIGATSFDKKFRAFDKSTGALLWETTLPFGGNATPVTYEVNGRQYVVIAAGGGKDRNSPSGGVYVAFTLAQ